MKRILGATAILAAATLLAACSETAPDRGGQATQAPHATQPAAEAKSAANLPVIPTGTGIVSAAKMGSCDTSTGGRVTAKGSITMPAGQRGDIVVSVSWVTASNSVVHGRGVATLSGMNAGQTKDWSVSADLPKLDSPVTCVLGAVIPKSG